jgi:ergothioneine biosynthesis protein EgtB
MLRNATITYLQPASRAQMQRTAPATALHTRFEMVRQATLNLAAGLSAEDCALQSMPDASPVKWHLAHTTWFFETFVLEQAVPGYRHFHPQFRVLFNSYYVGVGERHPRPERGLLSRPALEEILRYRVHVDAHMAGLLEDIDAQPQKLRDLIELGLHHEQQHQELILTDLKHLLSRNPLRPAYRNAPLAREPAAAPALQWIACREGLRALGHDGSGFAFDNELPRHRVFLESHAIASRLVTNGEYQAFIDDGGYTRPELWLSEGWDVLQAQRWQAPLYWEKSGEKSGDQRDGDWQAFTLAGMQTPDPAEPVSHVSYFEADAYARWAGARLPYEAEWEAAAAQCAVSGNFVEDGALRPLAAALDASAAPQQIYGDLWEWTHSSYAPYPGYRTAPGAVGEYNGKFMVNQYVLRGGSCATPRSHIRATYRNFFWAAARWQFSGIRLARDGAAGGR